ncbi:hypothetical protein BDW02DRAFT_587192 [Decorospora gaudefroyi]|uniref:endo-1,3(4)-beta-glucanase n=1 Tax=Decorospora gaudefroyi TaxID=184978 RepID=A0A6A5KQI9_9PLEO|nr:hypothetical protein BDW02DRAFT_587192 [Decorospora gaudefroyi]
MRFSTLTSAAALFELSIAGYVLEDDYMTDFYGSFDFFTGADPTEGFVQFVDEATAKQTNLINSSITTGASWGVDIQNQTPDGRPSMRIESKKTYDSGLIVLDVAHMPFGCGTWPAFWTIGPDWPKNGEIDILEGVNEQTNNGMTLHTGPGCQIGKDTTQFAGELTTGNCDIAAEGQGVNVGCSIKEPSTESYGAGLNSIGGGVYATQWTSEAISIYYFPRGSIPEDVLGDSPDPSGWGKPAAKFEGGCDITETFKQQKIIFDTTFCGQWAGSSSVWDSGTCGKKAATCEEWVQNNPEAFTEAYWTVNALKVYQDNGDASSPVASSVPEQSIEASASIPIPSSNDNLPTEAPAVSSGLTLPTDLPAEPTSLIIPSVSGIFAPIPTSEVASAVPSAAPTSLPNAAPLPTGGGGMAGFQWPVGGGAGAGAGPSDDPVSTTTSAAEAPESTNVDVPAQSSTGAAASSLSIVQKAPQPSDAPLASEAPAPAPTDAPPVVTNTVEAVRTVYETVYATVTVGADPTPAPAPARMARQIRQYRQRLTKHHAKH